MKALRDFNFGGKKILNNSTHVDNIKLEDFLKENSAQEQIDLLKKYKFIGPSKKAKKIKVKERDYRSKKEKIESGDYAG